MKLLIFLFLAVSLVITFGCSLKETSHGKELFAVASEQVYFEIEAENFNRCSKQVVKRNGNVSVSEEGWLTYTAHFPEAGRYRVEVIGEGEATLWLEDYFNHQANHTKDVTGFVTLRGNRKQVARVEGSPFNAGNHPVKLHVSGDAKIDKLVFSLMTRHQHTSRSLIQNMKGKHWNLVWADEFEGTEIDTEKWSYDIGNWGWGNNEVQYYTNASGKNALLENGQLLIELKKEAAGNWTSARLTTRGKVSFLYGKLEIRAIIPQKVNVMAAGWTLGEGYIDENSWPLCGAIEIMKNTSFPANQQGFAKATAFPSDKTKESIPAGFRTYSVEWTPSEIIGFTDGLETYRFQKTASSHWWSNQPQNIVLSLALLDGKENKNSSTTAENQEDPIQMKIDYVRVYERK